MKTFVYNKDRTFSIKDDKQVYGLIPASIERKGTQGAGEQFYKPSEAKHTKTFKVSKDLESQVKEWKNQLEKKDNIKYLLGFLQTKDMTGKPDEFVVFND